MDLDGLAVGWREGLVAIIALLLLYILVLFLRMRRMRHQLGGDTSVPAPAPLIATPQPQVALQPALAPVPESQPTPGTCLEAAVPSLQSADEASPPAWNPAASELHSQLLIDALRDEIQQLRSEVDELRSEVFAAREELRSQSATVTENIEEGSSPLYSGAMQLAQQGHDATTIAHHCGITRAEADLVVAMARSRGDGR